MYKKKQNLNQIFTMKKKLLFGITLISIFCYGCGGASQRAAEAPTKPGVVAEQPETHGEAVSEIKLNNPLDQAMVKKGQGIYDMKCSACHKLTSDRLVGPGWSGVTSRRKPEWIINMVTNVDMMLEKDAEAQKLLELCLVRMPNQNITKDEALTVLEYMRKNDGVK